MDKPPPIVWHQPVLLVPFNVGGVEFGRPEYAIKNVPMTSKRFDLSLEDMGHIPAMVAPEMLRQIEAWGDA